MVDAELAPLRRRASPTSIIREYTKGRLLTGAILPWVFQFLRTGTVGSCVALTTLTTSPAIAHYHRTSDYLRAKR